MDKEKRRLLRWKSEANNDVALAYVSWEPLQSGDLPQTTIWSRHVEEVTNKIVSLQPSQYQDEYLRATLALIVFESNRMEGTIDAALEKGATIVKIMSYMSSTLPEPPICEWCSEGERVTNYPSSDRQLFQSAVAVKYLLCDNLNSSLSEELIVNTHRLLMENSYNLVDHGRTKIPIEVGSVRTTKEVNAGMYQFTPARAVAESTRYLMKNYNEYSTHMHPISLATYLFYELITIHPFENGNGRLCRLFLAWSLMRDGFPFAVSLSSGHRSHRQHYIHAINRARNDHRGELNVILIISIERILSNIVENADADKCNRNAL